MTLGEIFITAFVFILFALGIYAGMRLYRWNKKDMREKAKKNEMIRNRDN